MPNLTIQRGRGWRRYSITITTITIITIIITAVTGGGGFGRCCRHLMLTTITTIIIIIITMLQWSLCRRGRHDAARRGCPAQVRRAILFAPVSVYLSSV